MTKHLKLGNLGEDIAARYMKKKGYKIIERGYKCKLGEIDIIARKGKKLIFAEVKYRSSNSFGGPVSAVGITKQKRLVGASIFYLKKRKIKPDEISFDVIAIIGDDVEHITDAFVPRRFAV